MPRKTDKQTRAAPRPKRKSRAASRNAVNDSLPSKEDILKFIAQSTQKVGKREIARAFGVKGGARIALKRILGELESEGAITGGRKQFREKGQLPPVAVIDVFGTDADGDLLARPAVWDEIEEGPKPVIRLLTMNARARDRERAGNIGSGDKVLARIERIEEPEGDGVTHEASAIKRLGRDQRQLLGILRCNANGSGTIEPINRKSMRSWHVNKGDLGNAKDRELVRFNLEKKGRFTQPQAKIVERLGNPDDERQISLIAIHAHGLPDKFPQTVLDELDSLAKVDTRGREDLTQLPLVTIDPPDARDHDDAVFGQPDPDPKNDGGHIVWVAIADVAHYVRPGSQLDREAQKRANSVYFPDRVVPMLPEKISNDLCSLREGELRPCLAVKLVFDKSGKKRGHRFMRATMRSHAKLSYQEAQAAIDGEPNTRTTQLLDDVLAPLWDAYKAVAKARDERSPLDLDLPERKIVLDKDGRVDKITVPERLDAHRLIEEFMIQANVAAAEALEAKAAAFVYRRHDSPSDEKLKAMRDFLETLDLKLSPGGSLRPQGFNRILARAKNLPITELVNEVILRSQAQAEYSTENSGHFGLNLARYAHFTSPIRRYADLLVHRALVSAYGLGEGGVDAKVPLKLSEIAKHISETERKAMAAERETVDRLIAYHLAGRVGATFEARIAGLTRSGLFVRLDDTGADGFVPASTIGDDYYEHDEEARALVGQRNNLAYRLGDRVEVRLVDAVPSAGALRFEMLSPPSKFKERSGKPGGKRSGRRWKSGAGSRPSRRGRGGRR